MKYMEFQGNKGGDYIKIGQTKAQEKIDCISLAVGCSCVVVLRAQVPVEFLTLLIRNFGMNDQDGNSRKGNELLKDFARELFTYDSKDFVKERLSRIKECDFWGNEIEDI